MCMQCTSYSVLLCQVQGYALYHLVKAQMERQAGATEDALVSLQTAMNFITSKKPGTFTKKPRNNWTPYLCACADWPHEYMYSTGVYIP